MIEKENIRQSFVHRIYKIQLQLNFIYIFPFLFVLLFIALLPSHFTFFNHFSFFFFKERLDLQVLPFWEKIVKALNLSVYNRKQKTYFIIIHSWNNKSRSLASRLPSPKMRKPSAKWILSLSLTLANHKREPKQPRVTDRIMQDAGKNPEWKDSLTLNFFDQESLIIRGLEEDLTSQESLGEGKYDIKNFKKNGILQIELKEKGQSTGTVQCQYTVKSLPPSPLLTIQNIKCEFFKQTKFILSTVLCSSIQKPCFVVSCGNQNMATKVKEEGHAKMLEWNEKLRIKIKDNEKITFNTEDRSDNSLIFGYEAFSSQFKTRCGKKKFSVIDKSYEPLGILEFDYETDNFVSKQESQKNEQKMKKQENQLTAITIEKIKGKLLNSGEDIYFKINLGSNMVKTKYIEDAKKNFNLQLNQTFYAEHKENKIIFAAYDKDLVNDDLLGSGTLALDGLSSGTRSVSLKTKEKQHIGDIMLEISTKKVKSKTIKITDLKVKLVSSGDILGGSEPYIVGRIGGWSSRTQTGSGQEVSFKRPLQLKFSDERDIMLEIMEEDVNEPDRLFQEKVSISTLKAKGQLTIPLKSQQKKKQGSISLKYETKNVVEEKKEEKKEKNEEKKKTITDKKTEEVKKIKDQIKKDQQEKKQSFQTEQNRNQSLHNSRDTFKLPSIAYSRNYGDKIFDIQSSTTLQKSIHVYSIPKADRFMNRPKYNGQPTYIMDSSFKKNSGKGAGFGYGNKMQFPEWMQRNMKENPAPGAYIQTYQNSSTDLRPKGPTFGISHKYYEKVTLPKEKKSNVNHQKLKPIKDLK